ncbi:hypothetical protein GpartN1_g4601.t1 [Galdieria partita]|uniref:Uncharacterized protein n=1 Tax=Galdieria partita TaxID=83374 RepID=A0A9C7PYJ3_9RHOD|nr:hypothetical protein GpartN1_g4601.t1 [Galdieria partita]
MVKCGNSFSSIDLHLEEMNNSNNVGRKLSVPNGRNVSCLFAVYISVICVVVCIFLVVRVTTKNKSDVDWLQVEKKLRFVDSRFNASVYVIDLSEDLKNSPFFKLSRTAWSKFAMNRIDYIAFFYKEPPFLVSTKYFYHALESLENSRIPGFGIALSTCGCIVPSSILEHLETSFQGLECLALPGFVVDKELIVWFDSDGEDTASRNPSSYCSNPKLLNMRIFPLFDNVLRQARSKFALFVEQKSNL